MSKLEIHTALNQTFGLQVFSKILEEVATANKMLGILAEAQGTPKDGMSDAEAEVHMRTVGSMYKVAEASIVKMEKLIREFYSTKEKVFKPAPNLDPKQ